MNKDERIDNKEFQAALANILMNPEVRSLFLDDAKAVGQMYDLSDAQLNLLRRANLDRMVEFSDDLWGKRINMLAKRCPNTIKLLQQNDLLNLVATVYLHKHLPKESADFPNRSARDFWWFAETLEQMLEQGEIACPYLGDILRCEKVNTYLLTDHRVVESAGAFQEAFKAWPDPTPDEVLSVRPRLGWHAKTERFSCNVVNAMQRLTEGRDLEGIEEEPVSLLFTKLPGWRKQRIVRINDLTRRLLGHCDGTMTTLEIVDRLVRENPMPIDPDQARTNCANVLIQMYRVLTVTFDRFAPA